MTVKRIRNLSITVMTVFIMVCFSNAEMAVSPLGISVFVEEGEELERELTLSNRGENDVEFKIGTSLIEDEEENRRGPQRDDLGDVIAEFNVGEGHWIGMAWDGEVMWGLSNREGGRLIAVTRDGEIVEEIQVNFEQIYGMCWDGEAFWIGNYDGRELSRMDTEGNIIASIRINGLQPFGITWDGENLWYGGYQGDPGEVIQQISLEGEILRTLNTDVLEGDRIVELCWVPEHMDGHMWIICCDEPGRLYQLNVEEDDVEIIQQTEINRDVILCIEHDDENIWHSDISRGQIWYIIDDGTAECRILQIDPDEGVIAGNESETIDLIINPEGLEEGIYNVLIEIEFPEPQDGNNEPVESAIFISAVISFDSPAALLLVNVTDRETGEPIEGVETSLDRYLIRSVTDEDGICEFEALPTGDYELTFTASDYLTQTVEYQIDGEGELQLEVEMLYSEFTTDLEEISVDLDADEISEIGFEVINTGNGNLTFSNDLCLIGDANAEPWELRTQILAGEILEEPRVQGVVFIEDLFYIACANNRDPQIVVMNSEGEVVNSYEEAGVEGRYGYKDLASDGEVIWGSEANSVFAFSPEGELIRELRSPFNPTNNLAYDNDRELLWISSTTTNIAGIDREGRQIAELDRDGLRIYGMAYWADDPDGFPLYAFHKDNDLGQQLISKFNPENGEHILVRNLEPENGGSAAAAFITNQYDIYSWVFMSVINDGGDDRIDIWQLDARTDWMDIEPTDGIIEPDEVCEFTLVLDATGLPPEVFEAELVFTHDGIGGETRIPITMTVNGGNAPQERVLQLHQGWNMISVNVEPDDNDIIVLTQELVDNNLLRIMKDGAGRFYVPEHNFNNIPGWNVAEGYQINMINDGNLTITGMPVEFDRPIPLNEGWQIVSYYPRIESHARIAFSGILDELILAKDEMGRFFNVEFDFCNMFPLAEGSGYHVKLSEVVELVWCIEENEEVVIARNEEKKQLQRLQHFVSKEATGENMSLLVLGDKVPDGEIGVYVNGNLVGSGVFQNGRCGVAVWGDDPTTPEIDGALSGQLLNYSFADENRRYQVSFETITGNGLYKHDDFQAIRLLEVKEQPIEFGIVSVYPNPFNSSTSITYNLTEAGIVNLNLFDLNGRLAMNILSGETSTGKHSTTIDGALLSSGVYIIELRTNGKVSKKKLTLIK